MHIGLLRHILFIDIETVPEKESYEELDQETKVFWDKKAQMLSYGKTNLEGDNLYDRAGIYAEFGKIICISVGYIFPKKDKWEVRIKSFYGYNEKELLKQIIPLFDKEFGFTHLCAHNGKEFDFPYLCRRMIKHGIQLPRILNISGLKPWEISHFDTLEMWKFGDYKHYTSLALLAHMFGIEDSKSDMDGSMVSKVYYKEGNLEKIAEYCNKDVYTLIRVFLHMKQVKTPENTEYVFLK